MSDFLRPVAIPEDERKLTWIFIFPLLCINSKGFMKALKTLNKKIFILIELSEMQGDGKVK